MKMHGNNTNNGKRGGPQFIESEEVRKKVNDLIEASNRTASKANRGGPEDRAAHLRTTADLIHYRPAATSSDVLRQAESIRRLNSEADKLEGIRV